LLSGPQEHLQHPHRAEHDGYGTLSGQSRDGHVAQRRQRVSGHDQRALDRTGTRGTLTAEGKTWFTSDLKATFEWMEKQPWRSCHCDGMRTAGRGDRERRQIGKPTMIAKKFRLAQSHM